MEEQNHIDKALAFMESLERLHNQLKAAEEQQKLLLAHLLDLKKEGKTDSEEYAQTSQQSKNLQDIIDKWRPHLFGTHGDGERCTEQKRDKK